MNEIFPTQLVGCGCFSIRHLNGVGCKGVEGKYLGIYF